MQLSTGVTALIATALAIALLILQLGCGNWLISSDVVQQCGANSSGYRVSFSKASYQFQWVNCQSRSNI